MTQDLVWTVVAVSDEIAEGGQKPVSLKGRAMLLCRSEGEVFAIDSRCSHDSESLHGGVIRKCTIVCPHHGARFNLRTGMPYGPPAFDEIRTYPVRVEGDEISVGLPAG